jgi:hypothetical protein
MHRLNQLHPRKHGNVYDLVPDAVGAQRIKPASSMRLRRRSREAGGFTRAVQLPLRFKPVDLGGPDRATSRQPEIICELFDRPDITSFFSTWVSPLKFNLSFTLPPS